MIVTQKRIDANRRNAQKSTGPRTPEGKAVARRNALKHGLTSLIVQAEDAERFLERANEFHPALRPQDRWQEWLSEGMALLTIRLDRVERMERKAREKLAWRAYTCWDEDRRVAVERVAARLRLDPIGTVGELTASPQGCDWLIIRWALLAGLADLGPWGDDQRRLAHDLLGTPPEARGAAIGLVVDEDGRRLGPDRAEAEVAREAIAALRERRELADEADEIDRHLTQADLDESASAELARLRRYEATLHRRLRWFAHQLQLKRPKNPVLNFYKPDFFRKPENVDRPAVEAPVGDPTPRTDYEHHVVDTYRRLYPDPPAPPEAESPAPPEVAVPAFGLPEPGPAPKDAKAAPAPDLEHPAEHSHAQAAETEQNAKTEPPCDESEPLLDETSIFVRDRTRASSERSTNDGVVKPARKTFPPYDEAEEGGPMEWDDDRWEPIPEDEWDQYPVLDWAAHIANQIRFEREAEATASG